MTGIILESRRNFLVRAAGFVAAASPFATSAAIAKAELPLITPEIVATIAVWKRAHLEHEAMRAAGGRYPGPTEDHPYNHANDRQWAALHAMQRAILGSPS